MQVSSSPFSYSSQCDPNLLTPSSTAGSPPQNQARKLVSQYPSASTPIPQQPTPPGSTKMYPQQWTPAPFDMNGQSSQPDSALSASAPVPSDYIESPYLNDGRRTPGPPEPYMGAFGVSDGPQQQSMNPPYYMMPPPMEQQQPQHLPMPSSMSLLNHHTNHQFRPRHLTPEDHPARGVSDRSLNGSPRRRAISSTTARVNKKKTGKARNTHARGPTLGDPLEEHKNCYGEELPPKLKPNCPEEERCIFESRWQHRHQKGQDMWESIQNDFKNKFQKCPGKEMLQMKFKRGRSKYIEWIDRDVEILREAWMRVEKTRYQQMLEHFIELGGSRNMRLNASDIECKVVNELKLEEGLYIESRDDLNLRRRQKPSTARRRPNTRGLDDVPLNDEMLSAGSHTGNEDDVINQVHGRPDYKLEDESPVNGNEMMDIQMWGEQPVKMGSGVMPPRTEALPPQMIRLSPSAAPYGRHR
ncbi:hypothetical protein B0T10DRAFT_24956 [Thelonectria olida]|uniref:Uncharacterized protein n=1 Tax=Thelonectria olida TaxID=1576542 RepID=A0A9P9ATX6_9HYPO|nr:hypothetical protein B0T10DRAFT_24956 [Thelonectria olida]